MRKANFAGILKYGVVGSAEKGLMVYSWILCLCVPVFIVNSLLHSLSFLYCHMHILVYNCDIDAGSRNHPASNKLELMLYL